MKFNEIIQIKQRRILPTIDENPKSPILFKFDILLDGRKLIKSSHYDFDLWPSDDPQKIETC